MSIGKVLQFSLNGFCLRFYDFVVFANRIIPPHYYIFKYIIILYVKIQKN